MGHEAVKGLCLYKAELYRCAQTLSYLYKMLYIFYTYC